MSMATDQANYTVGGQGLAWRETGGEIVVLDVDGSVYYGVNTSGAQLWKRLAGGATRRELTAVLTADGRVAEQRAAADVDEFLADLSSYGLLQQC